MTPQTYCKRVLATLCAHSTATLEEIRRLDRFIAEHSKRAEQAITNDYQERLDLR